MTKELRIDTVNIRQLRGMLNSNMELVKLIGQFAQLRVIVDANFVISDLLLKIRFPSRGRTALEELVLASVFEVYAPRWLEADLASAIGQIAKKGKVTEAALWSAWQDYQTLIRWDETWERPPEEFKVTDDPKDLPYVLLEKLVGAVGVLSYDPDIDRMGGNRLTLDFVLTTRHYARAAVVSVGIRVAGMLLGTIAIHTLLKVAAAVVKSVGLLPSKLRFVLLGVGVIAFLHPEARAWLTNRLRSFGPKLKAVFEVAHELASIEAQKREDAKTHLAHIHSATGLAVDATNTDLVALDVRSPEMKAGPLST
jgi:predicted nucleic acid-binding protein